MSTKEEKPQEIMEIKKSIVIDASPEVVFKAISDPNELTNWFPDQAILEPGRWKNEVQCPRSIIVLNI